MERDLKVLGLAICGLWEGWVRVPNGTSSNRIIYIYEGLGTKAGAQEEASGRVRED